MRIRKTDEANYNQTLFGIQFKDGVSQGDFNQNQLDVLTAMGGFQFEVINDCGKCADKDALIESLKAELDKLKIKKVK